MPPSVVDLLTGWAEDMTLLTCEPGYRLHTAAPPILEALRQRNPFRRRTLPLASGQDAWVGYAQAHDLFRYLRRTGYTLDGDSPAWQGPDGRANLLPLSLHRPFPLAQLLVVLRTYERLRRLVPGLAVLDLQGLADDLARALTPDDLAGVERLVQSHLTFLKRHLKRPADLESKETEDAEALAPPHPSAPEALLLEGLEARLEAAIDAQIPLEIAYTDTQGHTTRRLIRLETLKVSKTFRVSGQCQSQRHQPVFAKLRQICYTLRRLPGTSISVASGKALGHGTSASRPKISRPCPRPKLGERSLCLPTIGNHPLGASPFYAMASACHRCVFPEALHDIGNH